MQLLAVLSRTRSENLKRKVMKTITVLVALLGLFAYSLGTIEADVEEEAFEIANSKHLESSHIPTSVNWTALGAVSPVANQGIYPTSWAFAVAGVVEGRQFIKYKKLTILSKQYLIDCCRWCRSVPVALRCIRKSGGIDTEASYPYHGSKGECQNKTIGAKIKYNFKVLQGNETVLAFNVAQGPLAAEISEYAINHYQKGVFNQRCRGWRMYSVLIVGYGTSQKDGPYWILKTSRGTKWGEGGYMRLARNKNNLCGITNRVYYPIV